jgi:hypothetical protein
METIGAPDFLQVLVEGISSSNPFSSMWFVFIHGGWFIALIVLIKGFWSLWVFEIQKSYYGAIPYVLLAVYVPKLTEQTPKAAENIFAHMHGMMGGKGTLWERYWKGKVQENFTCEIVSRGGNVQYYVRVPVKYRTVFESSVFAQYPDAEIIEAADYINEIPSVWPNEKYEMWGTEFALSRGEEYPIRTYPSFEDKLTQTFKDPLASLLEFMGSLRQEEQIFIQIPIFPVDEKWREQSIATVNKLIGKQVAPKSNILHDIVSGTADAFIEGVGTALTPGRFPGGAAAAPAGASAAPPTLMQHLSPGEKSVIEQVQMKASKPGFKAKVRVMYIAPREIFNKPHAMAGIIGAFKQFSALDMNGFSMDKYTKVAANYFFIKQRIAWRQNLLYLGYYFRSSGRGRYPYILNTEELATIWHFPLKETQAPLLSKAASKKAEPPVGLPQREKPVLKRSERARKEEAAKEEEQEIPENIPFI